MATSTGGFSPSVRSAMEPTEPRVMLQRSALATIEEEIANAGRYETGGLLLGWTRVDLGVSVVAAATGPGRKALRGRRLIILDTDDLQQDVDRHFHASGGEVQFLGDWHLHHSPDTRPSTQDRASVRELGDPGGAALQNPLLVIVGIDDDGMLSWTAWLEKATRRATVTLQLDA